MGRSPAAAPATGSKHQHYREVEAYYSSLFGPAPPKPADTNEKKADTKAADTKAADKKSVCSTEDKPKK